MLAVYHELLTSHFLNDLLIFLSISSPWHTGTSCSCAGQRNWGCSPCR